LDKRFSALERMGQGNPDLVKRVSNGNYEVNPIATGFNVEDVVEDLKKLGSGKRVTGPARPRRMVLEIGAKVVVVGLQSASDLNGEEATIIKYNVLTGRWEASIDKTGETKALRAENLRPRGEALLEPGEKVVIEGLQSETGKALNGLQGEIVGYLHDGARFEVKVGEETKALKAENLRRLTTT